VCGRFARASSVEHLISLIRGVLPDLMLDDSLLDIPSYNIPPSTQVVATGRSKPDHPHKLALLKWGFVSSFVPDLKGPAPINARSESVGTKPMFRKAFDRQRCLILADGFYEWQRAGASKKPFFIRRRDRMPLAMAGIYDVWKGQKPALVSCAVLTTDANDVVRLIHDRMPVFIEPEDYAQWCDSEHQGAEVFHLLKPYPAELTEAYAVSPAVNSPRFNESACIEPINEQPESPTSMK